MTLNNKLYDGTTAPATVASRSLTGIVGSDDVTLGTSGTVAEFSSRNVGSYTPTVSGLSLSGSTAGNYTLSTTTVNPNASIQARSLTVTAQANSKLYDGEYQFRHFAGNSRRVPSNRVIRLISLKLTAPGMWAQGRRSFLLERSAMGTAVITMPSPLSAPPTESSLPAD